MMNTKALIIAVLLSHTAGVTASDLNSASNERITQHNPLQVASINDNYFRFTTINNFLDADLIGKLVNEEKRTSKNYRDLPPIERNKIAPTMEIRDEPRFDLDLK